jgi:endonuclease/exonuclease/phosphatase family metal-dependent hydrolase
MGLALYAFAGITVSDVDSLDLTDPVAQACPAPLLPPPAPGEPESPTRESFSILQGNLWMLPARPLLVPFPFSTDRKRRLERLVEAIRTCRPEVVLLQEVFERPMVRLLARHLPEYQVLTSGESDITGILNASGLVTLTRLPVERTGYFPFGPLPKGTKAVEALARKGILAVDVTGPAFNGTILNLHLYAWETPLENRVTWTQLKEVLDLVERLEDQGRSVLVAGDFNIRRHVLEESLPAGWTVADHGPTFDVRRNPYTIQGSNNNPVRLKERRLGTGVRTIDLLLSPPATRVSVNSRVLEAFFVSDHQFIQHTVAIRDPGERRRAPGIQETRASSPEEIP